MNNEDIAKLVSEKNKDTYNAVMKALGQKDDELKRHEQSLLWTFESILDYLCTDAESYNTALNDFKEHLINKFE